MDIIVPSIDTFFTFIGAILKVYSLFISQFNFSQPTLS